jgi:UDP-2-acetamido-3-amino-2,3-dideoxy-glucuronate N-acetyltransferase
VTFYRSMYWSHPTAVIDPGAQIGEGTKIWHFSHVCGQETFIGKDCSLGQNVYVAPRTKIGDGCRIQNNVSVYDLVELEDHVFCGPSMVFTNVVNPRAHVSRKDEFKRTLVKRGASLGANCTIVCGVTVGEFAFVGAGAVVSKDVPAFALVVGVPARRLGWMCQCGVQLNGDRGDIFCKTCESSYAIQGETCRPKKLTGIWEKK